MFSTARYPQLISELEISKTNITTDGLAAASFLRKLNCGVELAEEGTGFTPVRRRAPTINLIHGEPEKEWTVTRCNRLLRALTSRVAVLRRDISRLQSPAGRTHHPDARDGRPPKGSSQFDEQDWQIGCKRLKRTYCGRGGRISNGTNNGAGHGGLKVSSGKEPRVAIPGEIWVPTPVLHRARGDAPESQPGPQFLPPTSLEETQEFECKSRKRPRVKEGDGYAQVAEVMRAVKKKTPAARYSVYEGIFIGVEALLKATAPDQLDSKRKGARSLLSTCLRAVPHCIAQEEMAMEAELQDTGSKSVNSRDVSTEIYEDLEALGTSERGWKQLRVVVRSHGVQVISDAIKDGLIGVEFCAALVTLCMQLNAPTEASSLLSSILSRETYPEPKSIFTRFCDNASTRPLSVLRSFVEQGSWATLQYRQLSMIVDIGLLPLTWLATKEFTPVWMMAIHDLTFESPSSEPLKFMDSMLFKLARLPELVPSTGHVQAHCALLEAGKQTFSSLLTTLTSILFLSKRSSSPIYSGHCQTTPSYSYEQISGILRGCLARFRLPQTNNLSTHVTLLLLANLFIASWDNDSQFVHPDLVGLLLSHLRQSKHSFPTLASGNAIVAFLCSLARCCGRGTSSLGFEYLQQFHLLLDSYAHGRESDGGNVLHEIMVDSAFTFAQQAPDRKHLEYATRMETKFHVVKTKVAASTPRNSGGFRWEEGISEWVFRTPAPGKSALEDRQADSFDCDSPLRAPVRQKFAHNDSINLAPAPRSSQVSEPLSAREVHSEILTSSPASIASGSSNFNDSDDSLPVSSSKARSNSCESFRSGESGDELGPTASPSLVCHRSGADDVSAIESGREESSQMSFSSHSSTNGYRKYIDRAPRLSRRVLRKSLQWQLFDESDDELSFCSTSSQGDQVFQDDTNTARPSSRCIGRRKGTAKYRRSTKVHEDPSILTESEDELCL